MTIPEILKELEPYTGKFPEVALRAAVDQREAVTPELLRVLEEIARDPAEAARRKDCMLPTFAIYLLAQFRDRRAYPLLARICAAPGEVPFDLFGDTVTEGLCRLLASIYDGDPTPLQRLVEDEAVNEFVRSAALDTFLVLEATGQMPRPEVIAYFSALFRGRLERKASYAWDSLVCASANLPAPELIGDIRQAFQDDLVDPSVADLDGIEQDLGRLPEQAEYTSSGEKELIDDAINEMEWWHCFHREEDAAEDADLPSPLEDPVEPEPFTDPLPETFVRDAPKVGRNDPCPCGSGKKYKKCCLGKN